MRRQFRVRFDPGGLEIRVERGENLLRAAMAAGVFLNAACGGAGVCGKCRVRVLRGQVESAPGALLSEEESRQGFIQACQSTILSDLVVEVPLESQLDRGALARQRDGQAAGRLAVTQELESLAVGWRFNPALRKYYVELPHPSSDDNRSDLSRLLMGLKKTHGLDSISTDFRVIRELPELLRKAQWKITATLVNTRVSPPVEGIQVHGPRKPKLIRVEPGDTSREHYSVVLDIGTTTVWGQLLDLRHGTTLAEASDYNGQIRYGDDVITRIVHALRPGGLAELQQAVVATVNGILSELVAKARVSRERISHLTAAGNTTMTHLLLGINPRYIREAPYVPAANFVPPVRAAELGLDVGEHVHLYTFPSVSSYVGGDIVSGVLGSGFFQRKDVTLYMDVGTNGEIVVGNSDWMITASCSAGPAFEGGGLRHGMRATTGAIEDFRLDPKTLEPVLLTVGRAKPRGICGSGLINMLAELLECCVIGQNGKFRMDLATPRIREGDNGSEYVVAWAKDTAIGQDIVLTEADIDNVIRAKAAMFAGCYTLLESADLRPEDLDRVMIAGAFGSFLNIESAITIGLLPELPLDRFQFVGNGSLLGARLISMSNEMLDDAERVARMMTNVELSESRAFMDHYMGALFLPHTHTNLFPGVMGRINCLKQEMGRS
ncbi:MAG: ASKHA domain-containing protein [Thermodesulfobacteriota bacterium]